MIRCLLNSESVMTLSCFVFYIFLERLRKPKRRFIVFLFLSGFELCTPHFKACNYTNAQACLALLKLYYTNCLETLRKLAILLLHNSLTSGNDLKTTKIRICNHGFAMFAEISGKTSFCSVLLTTSNRKTKFFDIWN